MIFEIIIASFFIMSASLAGVLFTNRLAKDFLSTRLHLLISFSAGVFLVTAGALAFEVFEIITEPFLAALLIALGYLAAIVLHHSLPETHHHHDEDCHNSLGAKKILVGDAIHNVADGFILVPAFLGGPVLGITVTISIFVHEFLQEIAEFFVLKQAGFSTKKALLSNLAVSSTILIGVALSYLALYSERLEGVFLAVSAGFFTHIVIHDLFPRKQSSATKSYAVALVMVAIGAILMFTINSVLSESHSHAEEQAALSS